MFNPKIPYTLDPLFNPDAVAVIGASDNEGKLGYHVMKSLVHGGYKGEIVPVNPNAGEIMGISAFPSLGGYSGPLDLAVIVLPARLVPDIFTACIEKQVKGIVLITAGFKEIQDPGGAELQARVARLANSAGIPVIGPNTFGMVNLHKNLNASFTPEFSGLQPGGISLVSQSGGVSHLIGFLAMRENAGMSKIIGLGNRLNVDFAEILPYLIEDPDTKAIMIYMEGLDDPRRLIDAACTRQRRKPIVAYKTGSAEAGDRASLSHTGSMAGRHEIYEGALRQAGILTLDSSEELLDAARALSGCPLPAGNRIAVLSGQAGPAMAACDLCEKRGLELVSFSAKTQETINTLLPPLALRTNPVDMGPAWYDSEAISGIIGTVLKDEAVDGILILMMFASANRAAVSGISELLLKWDQKKPVIASIVAPPGIWDGQIRYLESKGALLNFPSPERAARAMADLWHYVQLEKR